MLHAALCPGFKGADTLLLWGTNVGMQEFRDGLRDVRFGHRPTFEVEGGSGLTKLSVRSAVGEHTSEILGTVEALIWSCSQDVLDDCLALIAPLLTAIGGHHYVDAQGGLAEQVLISVNEYPQDYRRKV